MNLAGFVAAQRTTHGIPHAVACRALGVSQAWFYKWRHGDASTRRARRRALAAAIAQLFARHKGSYGSPRITADLREAGWRVSVNTVAAVMAELHLVARPRRRRRGLTKADAAARKAPDLIRRGVPRHFTARVAGRGIPPGGRRGRPGHPRGFSAPGAGLQAVMGVAVGVGPPAEFGPP